MTYAEHHAAAMVLLLHALARETPTACPGWEPTPEAPSLECLWCGREERQHE